MTPNIVKCPDCGHVHHCSGVTADPGYFTPHDVRELVAGREIVSWSMTDLVGGLTRLEVRCRGASLVSGIVHENDQAAVHAILREAFMKNA